MYQRACDVGSGLGCHNLAFANQHGRGVKQDPQSALRLSKQACGRGITSACVNLGHLSSRARVDRPTLRSHCDSTTGPARMATRGGAVGSRDSTVPARASRQTPPRPSRSTRRLARMESTHRAPCSRRRIDADLPRGDCVEYLIGQLTLSRRVANTAFIRPRPPSSTQ